MIFRALAAAFVPVLPLVLLGTGACASAAPRWTAEDVRAREASRQPSLAMSFPAEQAAAQPDDAQFSDDFVPERDVASAAVSARIEALAGSLARIVASDDNRSLLTGARQQLEDARLAAELLRTAPLSRWKDQRALASAAAGALEQSVAALETGRSHPPG